MSDYIASGTIYYSLRRAIAKIRTSAHKFPIETDRYASIPREERLCILGCDAIGDEKHYISECMHPSIRKNYVPLVTKIENSENDLLKGPKVSEENFIKILTCQKSYYASLRLAALGCQYM